MISFAKCEGNTIISSAIAVPRAMRRSRGLVNATHCTDVLRDNAMRKTRSFRDKEAGAAPGPVGMIGPDPMRLSEPCKIEPSANPT